LSFPVSTIDDILVAPITIDVLHIVPARDTARAEDGD